jgi:hypothetical protein
MDLHPQDVPSLTEDLDALRNDIADLRRRHGEMLGLLIDHLERYLGDQFGKIQAYIDARVDQAVRTGNGPTDYDRLKAKAGSQMKGNQ